MRRAAALLLALLVLSAAGYVLLRLQSGTVLQNDLLALLPRSEQDPARRQVEDQVTASFSRRIVLLVGAGDAAQARAAAARITAVLTDSGLVGLVISGLDSAGQRRIGETYFPYRAGLLAEADRERLQAGRGREILDRALALVYGPGGFVNASLLSRDPFLLMPAFFGDLPLPQSRLRAEEGVLTVRDGEVSYVFLSTVLQGDPFSLSLGERFAALVAMAEQQARAVAPDLTLLRTGAVFYARAGAEQANRETSVIALVSTLGTVAMILLVFRAIRPVLLGLLSIASGILAGGAFCLWWFGELHVVSLLFGVSLIGISVDYSLQYFCEYFDREALTRRDRLRRVAPGLAVGLATTLIGYLTLLLAPFPGLRQVALFSVVGLSVSFATVLLWYPWLDTERRATHGEGMLRLADGHWRFWEERGWRAGRLALLALCFGLAAFGLTRLEAQDDVRRMQSLDPDLRRQELAILGLTGSGGAAQFFLVEAATEQQALETEEKLLPRLAAAQAAGAVGSFQAPAQFVPSVARQKENRVLLRDRLLDPFLATYVAQLGLGAPLAGEAAETFLTLAAVPQEGPFAFLSIMLVAPATHLVLLNGVTRPDEVAALAAGLPGVRLVSPAEDISRLFASYRQNAVWLLALSAVLMLPLLAWRYGAPAAARVMAPSLAAVLLTPPLVALFGIPFTFFNAMALVLVLSVGIDYSVFCRETSGRRKPVTTLAVFLAAFSTIMSFGLLAGSAVFAVHSFGMTMLVGITLAFLLAPAAGSGGGKRSFTR